MFSHLQHPYVLLVEDNRVHCAVTTSALEKWGFKVVEAHDGEEALARIQQYRFVLVLMDIEMPWMNGIKAAQRMRELKRIGVIEDMPIIALTADHTEDAFERCMEAGMRDLIPKHIWKPKWEYLIIDKLKLWLAPGQERAS